MFVITILGIALTMLSKMENLFLTIFQNKRRLQTLCKK